jgi:hypothetical protein
MIFFRRGDKVNTNIEESLPVFTVIDWILLTLLHYFGAGIFSSSFMMRNKFSASCWLNLPD